MATIDDVDQAITELRGKVDEIHNWVEAIAPAVKDIHDETITEADRTRLKELLAKIPNLDFQQITVDDQNLLKKYLRARALHTGWSSLGVPGMACGVGGMMACGVGGMMACGVGGMACWGGG